MLRRPELSRFRLLFYYTVDKQDIQTCTSLSNLMTTRSLGLCAASATLTILATAAAILTPVTPENRRPMGVMLFGVFFVASPAFLIASARASDQI